MSPHAWFLYGLTTLIWGSTWYAITFQLGDVDPLVSVIYRFGLAALLLFAWCLLRGARLRLSRREHGFILLQGLCLFGLNYWLIYHAELYLASGIVAVVFASLVFMNAFNARLFLGHPLRGGVAGGAALGLCGVGLLFYPEFSHLSLDDAAVRGLLLAFASTYVASLGNIVAAHNAVFRLPVISVNAWGMAYATAAMTLAALLAGIEFRLPRGDAYLISLAYLSVFGSIIAFGAYMRLLALIGPDRAAYNSMLTPVVALLVSTLFEDYRWTPPALAGVVLVTLGNLLVMRARRVARPAA